MAGSPEQEPVQETETTIRERFVEYQAELARMEPGDARNELGYAYRDQLDRLWAEIDMMNLDCFVSGPGVYPTIHGIEEEQDTSLMSENAVPSVEMTVGETAQQAESRGFAYLQIGEEPPRLWYMFEYPTVCQIPMPVIVNTTQLFAFFDERCTIVPVGNVLAAEAEDPLGPISEDEAPDPEHQVALVLERVEDPEPLVATDEEIAGILADRSEQLLRLLRSARFRRLSAPEQKVAVDDFLRTAEQDAGISDLPVVMYPAYAFVAAPAEVEPGGIEYKAVALNRMTVYGTCLALSMLGSETLSRKPIERLSDLFMEREGLVLTIELLESVGPTSGDDLILADEIIHVPVRGNHSEMVFDILPNRSSIES